MIFFSLLKKIKDYEVHLVDIVTTRSQFYGEKKGGEIM